MPPRDAIQALSRIRRAFHLDRRPDVPGDFMPDLAKDGQGLEELFPGCTVLWDHNPRFLEWAGHYLRLRWRDQRVGAVPTNFTLGLIAYRTDSDGSPSWIRGEWDRQPHWSRARQRLWIERAVFVPEQDGEPGGWVVIR